MMQILKVILSKTFSTGEQLWASICIYSLKHFQAEHL